MARWRGVQFGDVVDRFKSSECSSDAWDDILIAYALLSEKGNGCGHSVAKKLVNGKGIWELIGHNGNEQPRLLFYFRDAERLIVFVDAFIKQSKSDYMRAIPRAQKRRGLIERSERNTNVIEAFAPNVH
jgi:hypothetical protein